MFGVRQMVFALISVINQDRADPDDRGYDACSRILGWAENVDQGKKTTYDNHAFGYDAHGVLPCCGSFNFIIVPTAG